MSMPMPMPHRIIHTITMIATATASSRVVCCLLLLLLHSLHPSASALIISPRITRSSAAASALRSTNNNDDNNMSGDLKRILVTGANTGIGLALTKQLVSEYNCHVYLGSRNTERGAAAVEEVKKCTGKDSVELLTINVSDNASVQSAANTIAQKLGPSSSKLYAIVNNAGTGFCHNTPPSEILDTNTRGPRRVVDAFLPHLDSNIGRIVNLGSGAGPGFVGGNRLSKERKVRYLNPMEEEEIEEEIAHILKMDDEYAAYGGSKALLACYTMKLAQLYPTLSISILSPGYICTDMTRGMGASKPPEEGTISLIKCLFEELPASGWFWGSDGLRSPLHYMRNPGEQEYDGTIPSFR